MAKDFVSKTGLGFDYGRQILVDRRNKTSICFLNHLETAPIANWAQIHANGEFKKGRKRYSRIKVLGQDYSKGTGGLSVFCSYNLEPGDVKNLRNIVDQRYAQFKVDFYKVPDTTANKPTAFKKMSITRNPKLNNPWCIEITNGMAKNKVPVSDTVKTVKQFFSENLFYNMIATVDTFLSIWENIYGSILIEKGTKKAFPFIQESYQNNSQDNQNNPQDWENNNYR